MLTAATIGAVGLTMMAVPSASAATKTVSVSTEAQLRAAVAKANARPGTDKIVLKKTVTLKSVGTDADGPEVGDLDVTDDLLISGQGHRIDGNRAGRIFDVAPDTYLKLYKISLMNGFTDASGGAIRNAGELDVISSYLAGNKATGAGASGGAIFNNGGDVYVSSTDLVGNSATRAGGAIEANAGSTRVVRSSMTANSTGDGPGNGGALHLTGTGQVDVVLSTVSGNTATAEGGGLWNSATGDFLVDRSRVSGNRAAGVDADQGGGGLFNDGGTLTVIDTDVTDNKATGTAGSGGGILNNLGTLNVGGGSLKRNTAVRAGGGIEANVGTTNVDGSSIRYNKAGDGPGNGGGVHLTGAGAVNVSDSLVASNVATAEGGGLWNSATGTFRVDNSRISLNTVAGNDADQGGGGLFNDGGTLDITSSDITDNQATGTAGSGGGILNNAGALSVEDSTVKRNTAVRAGGGIETNIGTVDLSNVQLIDNTAGNTPGNGGGFHTTGAGAVTYDTGIVRGNTAANEGGGLWNSATGTMTVTRVSISGNTAPVGPNVFNLPPGGAFTIDGTPVPSGPNTL